MPEDCSRAKSRVARALLRKRGILCAAAPATCPLHAVLYGDQEQHKRALRRSLYKCAYCGKTFSSEDWLDRHFDRKHADTLAADGFCLGDLCDVLDSRRRRRLARGPRPTTTTTTTARATTTAAGRGGGGATTTTATTTGRAAPRWALGPRDALRRRFPGGRPREVQGGARGLLAGGRRRRALRRALRERKGAS